MYFPKLLDGPVHFIKLFVEQGSTIFCAVPSIVGCLWRSGAFANVVRRFFGMSRSPMRQVGPGFGAAHLIFFFSRGDSFLDGAHPTRAILAPADKKQESQS